MTTKRIPIRTWTMTTKPKRNYAIALVVLAICIQSAIFGAVVALGIQGCEGKADGAEPSLWRVTAYCPCKKCCGPKACGITASGTKADHRLVAGPPEIPFGTVVEVPGYGRCKVEDRGGAIRGKRLDVLFQTHAEAQAWGVKWVNVKVQGDATWAVTGK